MKILLATASAFALIASATACAPSDTPYNNNSDTVVEVDTVADDTSSDVAVETASAMNYTLATGEHADITHRKQCQEVLAQRHDTLAGVAADQPLVDQRLQRQRKGQRAHRRQRQEQQGQRNAAPVRPHEGQQAGQRSRRLGRAAGFVFGHAQESMRALLSGGRGP